MHLEFLASPSVFKRMTDDTFNCQVGLWCFVIEFNRGINSRTRSQGIAEITCTVSCYSAAATVATYKALFLGKCHKK